MRIILIDVSQHEADAVLRGLGLSSVAHTIERVESDLPHFIETPVDSTAVAKAIIKHAEGKHAARAKSTPKSADKEETRSAIMQFLYAQTNGKAAEIADAIGKKTGQVAQALIAMKKDGLAENAGSYSNMFWSLTGAGMKLAKQLTPAN